MILNFEYWTYKLRRLEYVVLIFDESLIEVPRIGIARQVAVFNVISNIGTSLKEPTRQR